MIIVVVGQRALKEPRLAACRVGVLQKFTSTRTSKHTDQYGEEQTMQSYQGRDVEGWMKSAHFIPGVYNVEDIIQIPGTR
jgi:hypothetical protein